MTTATFSRHHGRRHARLVAAGLAAALLVSGAVVLARFLDDSGMGTSSAGGLATWHPPAEADYASLDLKIERARAEHDNAFLAPAAVWSREADPVAARVEHEAHIDAWLATTPGYGEWEQDLTSGRQPPPILPVERSDAFATGEFGPGAIESGALSLWAPDASQ